MLTICRKEAALLNHGIAHTGTVRCVDFSKVQKNLLASAGTKGEFFVWDVSKPTAVPTAYKSTRLDEIISIGWNNKVGHIMVLGGKSGALSLWDLRKKSELIHIPTRFPISSIAWHPSEINLLMTSSADDHNPVIQMWDLRNASAPKATLSGHEKAVLSLSWCMKDPELLLSSGSDNRTLIWNPIRAEVIAELPTSSQWVHKTSWCDFQPAILANASLDGKINLYSIQDANARIPIPVLDETPAGDDFFDTMPKNFQAQSSSFSLQQTPKWLKRPVGATFGLGGRLARFTSSSTRVEIVKYQISDAATRSASGIKESLANQSVAELCQGAKSEANKFEEQDWDVIETLTSEHTRGALLKFLGFTKEQVEQEVRSRLDKILPESTLDEDQTEKDIQKEEVPADIVDDSQGKPAEISVFGEDSGDEDFLGIINAQSKSTEVVKDSKVATEVTQVSKRVEPFSIYPSNVNEWDNLITKAALTRQFDTAIDVCLAQDRLSDAFMLALCGGIESQKKVQQAYFAKTKVPYARLLSSIIAGDLGDVVSNADLDHWREILAILCNYAKPDDFSDLCEILGQRLEAKMYDQSHATLCYLAGSKLDHLIRIWTAPTLQENANTLLGDDESSPFDDYATQLGNLIKKISIFRKAVAYTDVQAKEGDRYTLSSLYSKYLEFAGMLISEGAFALATDYLDLVPASMDGVEALKLRLNPLARQAQPVQPNIGKRLTGMRNVYTQPETARSAQVTAPVNGYAPATIATPQNIVPTNSDTATSGTTNTSRQYVPTTSQPSSNPYMQSTVNGTPEPQQVSSQAYPYSGQNPPYQNTNSPYGINRQQQAPAQNAFAPPPSRLTASGPSILPAAQRKDITPWNDAPDIPQPAPRRATPSVRSAIASPFPMQASPTLQAFGPQQAAALAPPPKTRSPAPGAGPNRTTPMQSASQAPVRTASNPYAPSAQINGPSNLPGTSALPYAPVSLQGALSPYAATGPSPAQPTSMQYAPAHQAPRSVPAASTNYGPPSQAYGVPPQQVSSLPSNPPVTAQAALFAPPPKSTGGPPKTQGSTAQAPVIRSPAVGTAVFLEKESSRPGSPAPAGPLMPPPIYPPGDRSHISPQDTAIVQKFSALLQKLQGSSPEKYRRPLEDADRRLSVLYDQLNNSQLSPGTLEQVHGLAAGLAISDWTTAYRLQMELNANKMSEVRDWITGSKALIVLGKKCVEERWDAQVSQM